MHCKTRHFLPGLEVYPIPLTSWLQTDIAYATARFSLTSSNVKTHIHLSTGFMAWFMEHGSTIYERYRQETGTAR